MIISAAFTTVSKVVDALWSQVTLLVKNLGISGATNNTFRDDGPYKFLPTRYGDTTQGSFSPYGPLVGDAPPSTAGSVYFDGSGDYLAVNGSTALTLSGDFTIEAWVYLTANTADQSLCNFNPHQTIGISLNRGSSGNTHVFLGNGSSWLAIPSIASSTPLSFNAWHHIALVKNGSTTTLYHDGINVGSTSTYSPSNMNGGLVIGAINTGSMASISPSEYLNSGNISNFRVVKGTAVYTGNFTPSTAPLTAITGTSLLTCQDKGSIVDASTNSFTVTRVGDAKPVGMTPFAQKQAGYWSAYFDGSGDYLTIPYTASKFDWWSTDYTIEAWVFAPSWSTWSYQNYTGGNPCLIGNNDAGSTTNYWSFGPLSDGRVGLYYYGGSGAQGIYSTQTLNSGQWNHIAMTTKSGNVTIYVNGVASSPASYLGTPASNASYPLTIGGGSGTYINGYVSNLRVVKGSAVYSGNFTPPTAPLSAVAGTSLLTCQDNRLRDNSSNNFTLTRGGDVSVSRLNPFGATLPAPTVAPTGSVYFDGSGDYLQLPANNAFVLGTGDFTVEFWVNRTGTGDQVWFGSNGGSYRSGIAIGYRSNSYLWWLFGDGSSWILERNPVNSVVETNRWNHVAITRSSGTAYLYLNGVMVDSIANTTNLGQADNWTIGNYAGGYNLTGNISNFRVVKGTALYSLPTTARTATQPGIVTDSLAVYFDANNTTSYSGSGTTWSNLVSGGSAYDGTLNSSPTFSASDSGGSFTFNGSNSVSFSRPSTVQNDLTLACWFKTTSSAGSASQWYTGCALLSAEVGGISNDFGLGIGGGKVMFGSGNGDVSAISPNSYNDGCWHYAVGVRTKSTGSLNLYVDGVPVASTAGQTGSLTAPTTIYMGRHPGEAQGLNGSIAAAMVYSSALTSTDIITNFNATKAKFGFFDPPTEPLTAISGTSLLTCQDAATVTDASSNAITVTKGGDAKAVETSPFKRAITAYGGSGYFDGSGDYLSIPSNSLWSFGKGAYCIEMWFYPVSWPSTAYAPLIRTVGGNQGFIICNNGGYLIYHIPNNGDKLSAALPTTGMWSHIVVCRSGSTLSMFVNGTRVASATSTDAQVTGDLAIGGSTDWSSYANGYISDLRIVKGNSVYDPAALSFVPPTTPLTAIGGTSLLLRFDNAAIYDATGQNDIQTRVNARVDTSIKKYAAGSVYGSRTYNSEFTSLIASGARTSAFGSGDFTIEMWYYPTNTGNAQYLYDARPAGNPSPTNGAYPAIVYDSGVLKWVVNNAVTVQASAGLTQDAWNHVAFSRVSGTLRLFVNGTKLAEGSDSVTYIQGSATYLMAQASLAAPYALMGNVEDLRISYYGRYAANFTPPATEFPTTAG